jgi:hypothetical protein
MGDAKIFGPRYPGIKPGIELVNASRFEFDDLLELHDQTSALAFEHDVERRFCHCAVS